MADIASCVCAESLFDGWTGNFLLSGGWAFTQAKQYSNMTILHKAGKLNLSIVLAFPWNHPYSFDMGSDAHLTQVGNMQHDSSGANHRISDTTWSGSAENIVAGYVSPADASGSKRRSFFFLL